MIGQLKMNLQCKLFIFSHLCIIIYIIMQKMAVVLNVEHSRSTSI